MLLLLAGKRYGWSKWTQTGLAVGWIIIALIVLRMTVWNSLPMPPAATGEGNRI